MNASKQPVAGVQLLALESLRFASTGADGKFTMRLLSEEPVTIVAVKGNATALLTGQTGDQPIILTLIAARENPGHDVQQAATVVRDGMREITDPAARALLPSILAAQDPDMALRLAADENGAVPGEIVTNIVTCLAAANPSRAVEWAPSRLALISDHSQHAMTMLSLGMAAARSEPALADELSRLAGEELRDPDPQRQALNLAKRAAAAARMNSNEAYALICGAITLAREVKASDDVIAMLLYEVAQGSPELAAKVATDLPELIRLKVYLECVRVTASTDITAARYYLSLIQGRVPSAHPSPDVSLYQGYYDKAAEYVIPAIGQQDPVAALALARTVRNTDYQPRALALAAIYQPKTTALSLLHEAIRALADTPTNTTDYARITRMIYHLDPQEGSALFKQMMKKTRGLPENLNYHTGDFVYYGGKIDPAACRLLLEEEFARQCQPTEQLHDDRSLNRCIQAMATIDVDRALSMLSVIHDDWQRAIIRRFIARYLLLSTMERDLLPISVLISMRGCRGNRSDGDKQSASARGIAPPSVHLEHVQNNFSPQRHKDTKNAKEE